MSRFCEADSLSLLSLIYGEYLYTENRQLIQKGYAACKIRAIFCRNNNLFELSQESSQPCSTSHSTTMSTTTASGAPSGDFEKIRKKVDHNSGKGVPCDSCSASRKTCSRRLLPGGPPRCERCEKKNITCSWLTVGNRGGEMRKK